jgi:AcrR family transcriptional regulator
LARTQAADYEERRESIVDRAALLFADKGFSETSVADIARSCETSKSLIYHYYKSKEEILYAVMTSHVDQLIDDVENAASFGEPPAQELQLLLRSFMEHYVSAVARQKVLLNEIGNLPADKRATVVGKQRKIVEAVEALLCEMSPRLRVEPGVARAQTMLLLGMINWTHTWFHPTGSIKADRIADMAFALIAKAD